MAGQNQPGGSIETKQAVATEKVESNLSETAQLVNAMMKNYIMPVLRDKTGNADAKSLLETANEIIKAKLQPDDQKVIEFALACRSKQAEVHDKAEESKCDEKQMAVIDNYFSKLITTIKSSSETYKPESSSQMAA